MHPETQWNEAEGFLPYDSGGRFLQICGMTGTTAVMTAP